MNDLETKAGERGPGVTNGTMSPPITYYTTDDSTGKIRLLTFAEIAKRKIEEFWKSEMPDNVRKQCAPVIDWIEAWLDKEGE